MSEPVDYWDDVLPKPGYFDAFRIGQYPTLYPDNKTPVTADVLEIGLIFAGAILAFSLLLLLPGLRRKDRWSALCRILVGVFVLTTIMVCNFGQEWEIAEVYTKTPYKAGLSQEINGRIGVKIGLRSINITLKGDPIVQKFNNGSQSETINYNERISWDNNGWLVGRAGFGPYAGRFNQEFRAQQQRGAPYPILWIAEYFTIDGEGIRWGRYYLQAGYFAHIMLWTSLPLWLLSLILFQMVIRYGAYFTVMTGLSMLLANIIFSSVRNPNNLNIPFEDGHLQFHFGSTFWLCLFTGLFCCFLGIIITVLDHVLHEKLSTFFGLDITQDLEEFYIDPNEKREHHSTAKWKHHGNRKPTILFRKAHDDKNVFQSSVPSSQFNSREILHPSIEEGDVSIQVNASNLNTESEGQEVQRGFRRRTLFPTRSHKLLRRPETAESIALPS